MNHFTFSTYILASDSFPSASRHCSVCLIHVPFTWTRLNLVGCEWLELLFGNMLPVFLCLPNVFSLLCYALWSDTGNIKDVSSEDVTVAQHT